MKLPLRMIFVLLLAFVTLIAGCQSAPSQNESAYPITTPHIYEVVPGTEEWERLTPEERMESCRVPAEEISQMTTEALVETVINYPYLGVVDAGSTLGAWREGILVLAEVYQFTGLSELLARPDARACLETYMADREPTSLEYLEAERIIYYLDNWE